MRRSAAGVPRRRPCVRLGTARGLRARQRRGDGASHRASVRADVERFVHLSSLTVLGLPQRCSRHRRGDALRHAAFERPLHRDQDRRRAVGAGRERRRSSRDNGRPAGRHLGAGRHVLIVPRIVRLMRRGLMPVIGDGRMSSGCRISTNLVEGIILAGADTARGRPDLPPHRRRGGDGGRGAGSDRRRRTGCRRPGHACRTGRSTASPRRSRSRPARRVGRRRQLSPATACGSSRVTAAMIFEGQRRARLPASPSATGCASSRPMAAGLRCLTS